jgi:uncharacterized delta-60 repeat protein
VTPPADEVAFAVARQPDGKIVVAGSVHEGDADEFAVARYFANGTRDSGGIITSDFGKDDKAYASVVQADGRIIVVGASGTGSDGDFAVARFEAEGTPDTELGGTGRITTSFGGDDVAKAVALAGGNKIVVVGSYDGGKGFAVARYKTDGTLDPTFGEDGKVTTEFPTGGASAEAVVIQSDGKVVVAGTVSNGSETDFAVVRYTTSGDLDTRFGGGDGMVTTSFAVGSNDVAYGMDLRADGRIVVVGATAFGAGSSDFALAQYTSDGKLDKTFGKGDGLVTTDFAGNDDTAWDVVVQSSGKLVVAGSALDGAQADFAVARYNSGGALDKTFEQEGQAITDILDQSADSAYAVLVLTSGKVVAAGCAVDRFAVVRYQTTGALDAPFADGGKATTVLPGENACARAVAPGKANTIVVAGYTFNGRDHDFAVVRYLG